MSDNPIEWTERDVEAANGVLALSGNEDQGLPTLTDEEIVALDGIERDQIVALPFLDEHKDNIQLAGNVALRSLLVKGLAFPVTQEGDTEPTRLNANESITGVITLRRTGQRLITAERTTGNGKYWLYGYVHADVILEEEVNDSGIHAFSVYPVEEFAGRLALLADPAEQADEDGDPRELTQQEFEEQASDLLADTRAVTVVTGMSQDSETIANATFYAATGVVHGLKVEDSDGQMTYGVAPVSRETMLSRLQAVITGNG
ncbi:hypothetical protein [Arthrobacter castelli]|uniref:hypothetical protein n=1 Tax=Arthrobacter castelli TaxID=271431 RepID=UPI0003FC882F|nr:hypothetical protein [Arthrobacter castelli]